MKKIGRLDLRGTPEEMDLFRSACDKSGVKASAAIRDLCHAAVEYIGKNGEWPKQVIITDGSQQKEIPTIWITTTLNKVRNLEEFKDVVLTVMLNLSLDWDSDFSPHGDHLKELSAQIDTRLKTIRGK